jgi:hypothetical protein
MLRFRRDDVATTPSVSTGIGHRRRGPARPPRTPYGASLSFATTTHLWPLPDPPSRKPPQRITKPHWGPPGQFRDRALASSVLDSPCQGSRTGLTPPISAPVPSTPTNPFALRAQVFASTAASSHHRRYKATSTPKQPTRRAGSGRHGAGQSRAVVVTTRRDSSPGETRPEKRPNRPISLQTSTRRRWAARPS